MTGPRKKRNPILFILGLSVKAALWALIIAIPLLGVWIGSSLAVYLNGPLWSAVAAGALFFPVLPVAWELWARHRRKKKKKPREAQILTTSDRLILRTWAVNIVFVSGILSIHPQSAFTALSARGDWFLETRHGPYADQARKGLFFLADRLEWLYDLTHDNPFEKLQEAADDTSDPDEAPVDSLRAGQADEPPDAGGPTEPDAGTVPVDAGVGPVDAGAEPVDAGVSVEQEIPQTEQPHDEPEAKPRWPLPSTLHTAVVTMPESAKKSPRTVAAYLAENEGDPYMLAKAIHDYVADRVQYDFPALARGDYPPQDAATVNRTATGVCAGYSLLFRAIARHAGYRCVYVVGSVRKLDGSVDGVSHAWNAIRINGAWHLVDVTWDSAHASSGNTPGAYETSYLFTPPEVFALDHFPEKPKWQLVERPLSRGEFIRQPMMTPKFYAQGFDLRSPQRSQVTVNGRALVELGKPDDLFVLAQLKGLGLTQSRCRTDGRGSRAIVSCDLPVEGTYQIQLFSNTQQYGTFGYIGKVEVVNEL